MKHPTPNQKIQRLFLAAAGILCLLPSAHAAVMLSDYQFASGNTTGTSSVLPANATLSVVSSGLPAQVSINSSGQNASYTLANATAASTEAQSFANNYYIQFTLTPNATFAASLTSITFDIGAQTNTTTFNANFFVRSSLVGFDTDVGSVQTYVAPASQGSGNTPQGSTITLSLLPAFQNITTAVTFRIYAYGDNYNPATFTGGDRPRLDNLILNGTIATAVPEPGSIALAGLALTGLVIFRRKAQVS